MSLPEPTQNPAPEPFELSDSELAEFTVKLPKVELHRHLEGSFVPEDVIAVAQRYNLELPSLDVETLRPYLQVTEDDKNLIDFLKKFDTIGTLFTSREVIEDLSYYAVEEAAKDNVRYLELRFSPIYIAGTHSVPDDEVMEGVIAGVDRANSEFGIDTKLILIVERRWPETAPEVLRLAKKYRDHGIVALDLANDELNFPPGLFVDFFKEVRQEGFRTTIHAGEDGDPENIRVAVRDLEADRLGHGVKAMHDPSLEALLRDTGTPLELCPTSNLQTQVVESYAAHPLRAFFDRKIHTTINTDDPGVCGVTLSQEMALATREFSFTRAELEQLSLNAVEVAFVSEERKAELRREVAQGFQGLREGD